jgi:hypothetical protein
MLSVRWSLSRKYSVHSRVGASLSGVSRKATKRSTKKTTKAIPAIAPQSWARTDTMGLSVMVMTVPFPR